MLKKYDLYVSVGSSCLTSDGLRLNQLQFESLPFDWLKIKSLSCAVHLIKNKFKHWLHADDLAPLNQVSELHDIFINHKTGVEYRHDFMTNLPLSHNLLHVEDKYNRRIERFYKKVEKAQNILMVYTDDGMDIISDEDIIEEHQKLIQTFSGKHIDLLYVDLNHQNTNEVIDELNHHITRIKVPNKHGNDYNANKIVVDKLLSRFKISWMDKLRYKPIALCIKLRKLILKLLSHLVFSVKVKQKLRMNYKNRF